ncbi:MAG TPA: peptide-methionine (S)-S-oxide reductase MsrA [Chthoniobacterales bacterium]
MKFFLAAGVAFLAIWGMLLPMSAAADSTEILTVGGGCFWCTEAVFEKFPGVKAVVSGYEGGSVPNPSYERVCTGTTGHAEVIQIEFDPKTAPLGKLLDLFFLAHDPTSLNRQGADAGTQYRSVIFYSGDAQKAAALAAKERAQAELSKPIVTEISPTTTFYPAEDYHQDYFQKNPHAGYCTFVIRPKIQKLEKSGVLNGK